MIITESSVWIAYPKTASTFVRDVLYNLYNVDRASIRKRWRMRGRSMKEIECPELRESGPRYGKPTLHGTVSQIPEEYQHLPIISVFRCPLDRLISLYEYGDWKKEVALPTDLEAIQEHYPDFLSLRFSDFLAYLKQYYGTSQLVVADHCFSLGALSADFLRFFLREPPRLGEDLVFDSWPHLRQSLADVKFLATHRLRDELVALLKEHGFHDQDLQFIQSKEKVNRSQRKQDGYFDDQLTKMVRHHEWLIFAFADEILDGETGAIERSAKSLNVDSMS